MAINKWSGLKAIQALPQSSNERLDVKLESPEKVTWRQGDAQMEIGVDWRWRKGESFEMAEDVYLLSRFNEPRPASDHLQEHWKFRALLTLLFGEAIYFREQWIRTESEFKQLIPRSYYQDYSQEIPSKEELSYPIFSLSQISSEDLEKWFERYDKWQRLINPTTALMQRRKNFVEDIVLSASMGIEAAGYQIGTVVNEPSFNGRNIPFTNHLFRCLSYLNLDCSDIAHSNLDLASAAAEIYRGVKHADQSMPDPLEMWLIGKVLLMVARLVAVKLSGSAATCISEYTHSRAFQGVIEAFQSNGRKVESGGRLAEVRQSLDEAN